MQKRISFTHIFSNRPYLLQIVCMLLAVVLIPICLGTTVYYVCLKNITDEQAGQDYRISLENMKERVESITSRLENDSFKLIQDDMIGSVSMERPHNENPLLHWNVLWKLSQDLQFNPNITELMFYNPENGHIISSEYGCIEIDRYSNKQILESIDYSIPGTRWICASDGSDNQTVLYLRPVTEVYGGVAKGILIYFLDSDVLADTYSDFLIFNKNGSFYLFDQQSNVLLSSGETDTVWENNPVLENILPQKNTEGQVIHQNAQGTDVFYSYYCTDTMTYLLFLPVQDLNSRIGEIRLLIIFIASLLVITGIVATLLVSRSVYTPIQRLLDYTSQYGSSQERNEFDRIRCCMDYYLNETHSMYDQLGHIEPLATRQILKEILHGQRTLDASQRTALQAYGFEISQQYVTVVIQPNRSEGDRGLDLSEMSILLFALTNIMTDLLKESRCNGNVLSDDGEEKVLYILRFPLDEESEMLLQKVYELAQNVVKTVSQAIAVDVLVSIGGVYESLFDIGLSLEEADKAFSDSLHPQDNITVFGSSSVSSSPIEFRYPELPAQELIDAILTGSSQEVSSLHDQFFVSLQESDSVGAIRYCYFRLIGDICRRLDQNGVSLQDVVYYHFYQLRRLHSLEDIKKWADYMVSAARQSLKEASSYTWEKTLQKVCSYIRQYDMSQISLTQCAEYVSLSPVYLSRLFKEKLGVSFREYTTSVKVIQAKHLLRETDWNISTIAQQLGYSERSLSRIFQRREGITPGQFRAQYAEKSES